MTTTSPISENRFPDCVRMELEVVPVLPENPLELKAPVAKQVELVLDIRFGEHLEPLDNGSVTFGLKRGELRIKLDNGSVPLRNIKLSNLFSIAIEKQLQQEDSTERQESGNITLNPGATISSKQSNKNAATLKLQDYQVNTRGTAEEPIWIFETKVDNQLLQGLLQAVNLATVNLTARCLYLEATFTASIPKDIQIVDANWLWTKKITKKKTAVIEKAMVRHLLEKVINQKAYLSRVEVCYEQ